MKWLAAILLIGVFIADFTWRWLAQDTRFSQYAVWYMLQGFWVMTLCLTNVIVLLIHKRSVWRDAAIAALAIGAIEGFKAGFFRWFVDDPGKIPRGVDVSDYVTGLPLQTVSATLYIAILTWTFIYHAHARYRSV